MLAGQGHGPGQLLGRRIFARGLRLPLRTLGASFIYSLTHLIHKHPVGSPAGRRLRGARLSKALLVLLRSGTRAKSINTRQGDVLGADGAAGGGGGAEGRPQAHWFPVLGGLEAGRGQELGGPGRWWGRPRRRRGERTNR